MCCASCGWIPKWEKQPVASLSNIFSSDYEITAAKFFRVFLSFKVGFSSRSAAIGYASKGYMYFRSDYELYGC